MMLEATVSGAVVVVGSVNLDETITVSRLPGPGETVIASRSRTSAGGKGANQAVAAARAGGATTCFIGCLGADEAAQQLSDALSQDHVVVEADRYAGASGRAIVMISEEGENLIAVVPGANGQLREVTSAAALHQLRNASVVVLQLEAPASLIKQAGREKRGDALLILNAAPAVEIADALWEFVDLLVVNEHEATSYTAIDDPIRAANQLLQNVPRVIVTMGENGSFYTDRNGMEEHVEAVRIDPVDTTGAGDTFCGVLAAHLSRGDTTHDAMLAATRAAALATLRHGAQPSIPTVAEINQRFPTSDSSS